MSLVNEVSAYTQSISCSHGNVSAWQACPNVTVCPLHDSISSSPEAKAPDTVNVTAHVEEATDDCGKCDMLVKPIKTMLTP